MAERARQIENGELTLRVKSTKRLPSPYLHALFTSIRISFPNLVTRIIQMVVECSDPGRRTARMRARSSSGSKGAFYQVIVRPFV